MRRTRESVQRMIGINGSFCLRLAARTESKHDHEQSDFDRHSGGIMGHWWMTTKGQKEDFESV